MASTEVGRARRMRDAPVAQLDRRPRSEGVALISLRETGADEGIRTLDPNLGNEEMAHPTRFERVADWWEPCFATQEGPPSSFSVM
jgi:hypothetical protein